MASTLSLVAAIAKRMYSDGQIGEQTRRFHVLYEMLKRRTAFGGEDYRYIVRHANPQSVAGVFGTAQTQATSASSLVKAFATSPGLKYGVIQVDGPSLRRLEGNAQSFVDHVRMEFDGVFEELGNRIAFDLYRNKARRGRRASASTNVITLTDSSEVINFTPGMTVMASANADASSPRTGSTTVASIQESAGTITLTSAAGITSFADNDYLFALDEPATAVDGLEAIIPLAAPSATAFRGVDRSGDARRLAGVRLDDTATYPEVNTGRVATDIFLGGKRANCAFWHPTRLWEAAQRMHAQVEFQQAGGQADYGFQFLAVHSPGGIIKIYADPDCPYATQWVGDMSVAECRHLKSLPGWVMDDNLKMLRMGSADAVEGRCVAEHQLIITEPGRWGTSSMS